MVFMTSLLRSAGTVFLGAAILMTPAISSANDDGPFAGKQMRFYTMGGPGGGYDTYMRALIPPVEKALGAKLIPTNEVGAGGLVAMNRIVSATPDGMTLGLIGAEALVTAQLYKLPGVNYDLRTLEWVARVSAEAKVVLVAEKSSFRSLSAMSAAPRPITWAGTGKADGNSDFSAILAHATGMKSKIIVGYNGSGGMNVAIENGEVDGRVVSDESAALFTKGKQMRVLAILARERSAQFPETPTVFEQMQIAPEKQRMLDWRAGAAALGRVVLTTPNTPADRLQVLRKAFAAALQDPETIAELRRRGLEPGYASGQQVTKMVADAVGTLDEPALATLREVALERYY